MGTGIIPFQATNYLVTAVGCTANCGGLLQQGFAIYFIVDSFGNVLKTQIFNHGLKNKFMDIGPKHDGGLLSSVLLAGAGISPTKIFGC